MKLARSRISAVILAGGKSTRMGGVNKGLLSLHGRPMISHVIERLSPQVASIIISANQDEDQYRALGYEVVNDMLPGTSGPLAGIYAAMTVVTTEWLVCVPCDVPRIPTDFVARLSNAEPSCLARVAHDGTRQQSACCLLHIGLREKLKTFLGSGRQAVYRFLAEQDVVEVDFSDQAEAFININTERELQQLD